MEKKGGEKMDYAVLRLKDERIGEAQTKLHFALATERALGHEFLRVDFLGENSAVTRLRGAVLRVLRERKRSGKLLFFLLSEELSSEKPEAALLANKYPSLLSDPALANAENACILVKL